MRLKESINNFNFYLTEISYKFDPKDKNVNKLSRGKYSFSVGDDKYLFQSSPITMKDGRRGFLVEWGLLTPEGLSTEITGDKRSKIRVFRNVLTCLAKFINDENPEVFSMYVNKRLVHVYDAMWASHYKDKPFSQYTKDEEKHGELYIHYFTRTVDDYVSESDKYRVRRRITSLH